MFMKVILLLSLAATFVAASPVAALAQTTDPKREKRSREVKEKIQKLGTGQSAVVKIKLYNNTEHKGYVAGAGGEDFELVDTARNSHTIKYSDVRSIGGKNMSTGKKIAIGVGIGAGITVLVLVLIFNELGKNS